MKQQVDAEKDDNMAINISALQLIIDTNIKGTALSAGYPDLLVERKNLPVASEFLVERLDSEKLSKFHGVIGPIYETVRLFEGLGITLDIIGRERITGDEKIVDLNIPQNLGKYDLVIDPGTSEHCFNIAQALQNLACAVKVGGYIINLLPVTMVNHGYWNINPNVLQQFYDVNGFEVKDMFLIDNQENKFLLSPEHRNIRIRNLPSEVSIITFAQRKQQKPFSFPQQQLEI